MKNDVGMRWEMVRLGDVLDYEQPTNYIVKSDLYDNKFKTPVLTAGKSFILGYTDETDGIFSKLPVIIFDDFTTVSKYVDFPFKVKSSAMKILKAKEGVADTRYMFYLLQTLNLDCEQHKRYWISKFAPFQIPLPPLPIQKRIAEILDAADALKLKDQALLKKYDELAQAIFIDMFGDPVKNEKGWEVKSIREFGKISTGNTPSRAESKNYNSNYIEWIKTDNIEDGSLYISKANEYLSEIGFQRGRATTTGSLLVACIAGSIDSIGRAALTNREVTFNQQINSIEPNEKVNSIFLYYLIKYSRKHIQNHASNGMKRMLSKGEFEKIKLILPNLNIQQEFERKINHVIIQNEKVKNALANSGNLFQALIQKAFKGELVK